MAQWGEKRIVLKSDKPLTHDKIKAHLNKFPKDGLSRAEFIKQADKTLYLKTGRHHDVTLQALEEIFSECDLLSDGVLRTRDEVLACWSLVNAFEYVLYLLLKQTGAMPELYGVCGKIFAVEFAPVEFPLGVESMLSEESTWQYRARLAVAFLDMIEALESTPYGPLHLCDVKEENFGSSTTGGKLVLKALDVHASRFEGGVLASVGKDHASEFIVKNKSCESDFDCHRAQCVNKCNHTTGKCSDKLVASNLRVSLSYHVL